jgi:hypothetical protein
MESQQQYEARSLREAAAHEREIDSAPLADRKEAQAAFLEVIRDDPALVAERISWLIDGNYGYGEMLKAKQVVAMPRSNRIAALTQLIAVYEWMTPRSMAVAAWKKLTNAQKQELDRMVEVVIKAAEKELRDQGSQYV